MWRKDHNGEVYAYLVGTDGYGEQLGCGNWTWQPGQWTKVNGVPVLDATGLMFRTVSSLQINSLYFSTFFGGSDSTWVTPQNSPRTSPGSA